jgi:hypothetical protein
MGVANTIAQRFATIGYNGKNVVPGSWLQSMVPVFSLLSGCLIFTNSPVPLGGQVHLSLQVSASPCFFQFQDWEKGPVFKNWLNDIDQPKTEGQ